MEIEYSSLVFSTWSALSKANDENREQMFEAIQTAKTNTEKLNSELKGLFHGLRGYLQSVQNKTEVNEILSDHFVDYQYNYKQTYEPIKTTDSIPRFKEAIVDLLYRILQDDNLLKAVAQKALSLNRYPDEDSAFLEMDRVLRNIIGHYNIFSDLLAKIDDKIDNYTQLFTKKTIYLTSTDKSTKDRLVHILKSYASAEENKKNSILRILQKNIHLNPVKFIDGESLYHPKERIARTPTASQAIVESNLNLETELEKLNKKLYNAAKIMDYIKGLFPDGSGSLESSSLTMENDNEFILLFMAVARSNEKAMNFTINLRDGNVSSNGYFIPDMTIHYPKKRSYVE
jgi:hypothetical protein